MFRVSLVNMPFAALHAPSIALTQLRSVLARRFGGRLMSEVLYLNHDFGHYFGIELYEYVAMAAESHNSGMGDWLFRQAAFPDLKDNSELYFRRFFPVSNDQTRKLRAEIEEKRAGLEQYVERLIERYELAAADVVGLTSMFAQNVACFTLARKLKEIRPEITVVMGGANCESPMGQEILRHVPQIDYVFSGPALKSFPDFLQHRLDGEDEKAGQVRGVFSKSRGLATLDQTEIGEELEIDAEVELDYDSFMGDIRNNFPNREVKPILMFETSRGCWWGQKAHCTFCGLNGLTMSYRAMQPEKAVAQINSLFRYAPECERYECVDNIMPTNYPTEVFPHLQTPTEASIFYEVKADLTADEMQALSSAGVRYIQPGIEALATSTLKLMKKGTTSFQNIVLLKNCLNYGLFPVWNLLVGFPGEGEEVYRKYVADIPHLTHLIPPSGVFPVRYDRFSPYFVKAEQYGLDLQPFDFYTLTYPFGRESLSNLAYYFVDRNFNAKHTTDMIRWIGPMQQHVGAWRASWYDREIRLRPRLHFKQGDEANVIHDTRSGEAAEHRPTAAGVEILRLLDKPKRVSQLAAELTENAGCDVAAEVEWLRERGLVFTEGDRFISLVLSCDREPVMARE